MEFFEIVPEFRRMSIILPSKKENDLYQSCLNRFSGMTAIDIINSLGTTLNPRSFSIVCSAVLNGKIGGILRKRRGNISDALIPDGFQNIPVESCLALIGARFQQDAQYVEFITENFNAYAKAIKDNETTSEILQSLAYNFGYSKILIKKVLLSLFVYNHQSDDERIELETLLHEGKFQARAREIYYLAESLRPRGHPFSMWSSYEQPLPLSPQLYSNGTALMDGICPIPVLKSQIEPYLNSLAGFSLPDQVAGLKSLIKVSDLRGWNISKLSKEFFGDKVFQILCDDIDDSAQKDVFESLLGESMSGFTIHTTALAFPDLGNASLLRHETDRLTLPKLISLTSFEEKVMPKQVPPAMKKRLRDELSETQVVDKTLNFGLCPDNKMELAHLLRFLRYREAVPLDMDINGDAIAILLGTGVPSRSFINQDEISKFIAQSQFRSDHLGTMLWCSVAINGRLSDDADYDFLRSVEQFVLLNHDGDIVSAFTHLGNQYPKVAVSIIKSLTPRRIQKCYLLVSSYSEVNSTHRKLLEIAARITGDVELIMQADQILLDEKLASVRAHIDSSRIYIEDALFNAWVVENVWPHLEALRQQVFLILPGGRENLTTTEIASFLKGGSDALGRLSAIIQEIYLNDRLIFSYETFCRDHYFGVDSFLGRRIRHNATHGLLLGQLQEICDQFIGQYEQDRWEIQNLFTDWKSNYIFLVDDLVNNLFRFNSQEFPSGILSADADPSSEKFKAMASDVIAQVITGSPVEIVIRALTSGCWGILDPELKKIRVYLKGEFTKITTMSLDETFRNSSIACRTLQNELKATLLERIERLASWFSPFNPSETSLSLHDLSRLILSEGEDFVSASELSISGNAHETLVIGGQSRILYDCLHVLLVNAVKHSSDNKEVRLRFDSEELDTVGANELTVVVSSYLPKFEDVFDINVQKYEKMNKVLFEETLSQKAMIVHGYSGLRKLRYLMYRMGREDKISLKWSGDIVTVSFTMPIDFAAEHDDGE